MSQQMNSGQRTLGLFVALLVGGVTAAFLFPIAIDIWVNEFATGAFSGAGKSMIAFGDVVMKLTLFVFLTYLAVKAARR